MKAVKRHEILETPGTSLACSGDHRCHLTCWLLCHVRVSILQLNVLDYRTRFRSASESISPAEIMREDYSSLQIPMTWVLESSLRIFIIETRLSDYNQFSDTWNRGTKSTDFFWNRKKRLSNHCHPPFSITLGFLHTNQHLRFRRVNIMSFVLYELRIAMLCQVMTTCLLFEKSGGGGARCPSLLVRDPWITHFS